MASIIPGYEYDIFISYRQKDNKYDGWVTDFVDNLKRELEATFKEAISVYFDINPHDGLLETHDVDESLKEKLKCLVFIPVISRTYCDPKSFAWEHEFNAFVEQASRDQFGLKVKLQNGNVGSRVLPVQIHDLDNADTELCESILGGVLRGIEFIYKEPGVNRSLSPKDYGEKNLNNTNYRNQINKVALAVKEIILGLKNETAEIPLREETQTRQPAEKITEDTDRTSHARQFRLSEHKLLSAIALISLLVIIALFVYPKIFNADKLDRLRSSDGRISVAVMPFQNMTNDTVWNVWQEGIQDILITYLSNSSDELKVRQIESISDLLQSQGMNNFASITPSFARTISQKLDANIFIFGSIKKAGNILRVNAELIDSKTEETFKSFEIEGTAEEDRLFYMIDSLKLMVKDFLIISKLEKEILTDYQSITSTKSPEAYRYFIYGQNAYQDGDFPTAVKMFSQAIAIDSNFFFAILKLGYSYGNQGLMDEAKEMALKIYEKRDQMPIQLKIRVNRAYAICFETPYEEIKYLKQLQQLDDQMPINYYSLGETYYRINQYDQAISALEKALEIYKKWNSKPMWDYNYTLLGEIYHKTGQYKKEKKLYKDAETDFPGNSSVIYRQAILALSEGDISGADEFIRKYISILQVSSSSETAIKTGLAEIYSEAGMFDKAEEYYRQALALQPDNPDRLNDLACFLVEKDRNIDEGLILGDKALELNPDNYLYYESKGWGLFKQGKYEDALVSLEKADSLKPLYTHSIYLHLEEVKKAIDKQKSN